MIQKEINRRQSLLDKATEKIEDAITLIKDAMHGTSYEQHAKSYIIPHLMTWIGEGNPYDYGTTKYRELLEEELIEE